MEILTSEIVQQDPSTFIGFWVSLLATVFFLGFGLYWLFEILAKKEPFSLGAVVFTIIGVFAFVLLSQIIKEYSHEYEEVKAIVTDWNVVYEEGWTVIEREDKLVTLHRRIEESH